MVALVVHGYPQVVWVVNRSNVQVSVPSNFAPSSKPSCVPLALGEGGFSYGSFVPSRASQGPGVPMVTLRGWIDS